MVVLTPANVNDLVDGLSSADYVDEQYASNADAKVNKARRNMLANIIAGETILVMTSQDVRYLRWMLDATQACWDEYGVRDLDNKCVDEAQRTAAYAALDNLITRVIL